MKSPFVRLYLLATAFTLAVTAAAKLPVIFHGPNRCIEDAILGDWQPDFLSNQGLLGIAAAVEVMIVLLICFSPWHWLPCLACAVWGTLCVVCRLWLMDPNANCRCLGWLAKPGLTTNLMVGALAFAIALGGWLAFKRTLQAASKNIQASA